MLKKVKAGIGKKIKLARIEKGLTQRRLAEKLGLSNIAINKYESSQREPSFTKLKKITEILDKPAVYFLGEESDDYYKKHIIPLKKTIYVPLFSNLKPDQTLENNQLSIEAYLSIPQEIIKDKKVTGALKVISDSMEPEIMKGTYALFDNQSMIKEDDIAVLYINEKGTIIRKVHFISGDLVELIPLNKKYSLKRYKIHDMQPIGKVIGNVSYTL